MQREGTDGRTMTGAAMTVPQTVEDTGIRRSLLEDLALKMVYLQGELTLLELAGQMKLGLGVIEELFQRLRREQFCEVKGMTGSVYRITTTSMGKTRALELMSLNQYVGAAPVSLQDYVRRVRAQTVRDTHVRPSEVEKAFAHLVLEAHTVAQLGTAVVSGTSIFLHGPTGTGKTTIAENLPRIYGDEVWIPYAVEVDAQVIAVYDSVVHDRVPTTHDPDHIDGRWVLCRRPRIISGGELTIEMLDLQYNPLTKFYSAPLQMKANNGVLIIDDFGRQRVRPEELLNRWIVPLDRKIDFLTLAGGKKFEIPFDLLVVFSTNLDPASLADEAFMRRINNKIRVDNVSRPQFQEIFRRVCHDLQIPYDSKVVDHVMDKITGELNQPLRPCYARDIVQQIIWRARYDSKKPTLDRTTVENACRNYFLGDQARPASAG